MIFNNIIYHTKIRFLLFILIASSIPNIWANTNSENSQSQEIAGVQTNAQIVPAAEPSSAVSDPALLESLADQDPVELRLSILSGMCEYIVESLEKNKWDLPHDEAEKKNIQAIVLDTFGAAYHILKTFKEKNLI